MLSQTDPEGRDHPVACFSHKLLNREQKYSTIEKECLAIKLAVKTFQMYLLGRPFIMQTDHWTLQWLSNVKDENRQLAKWSLALQPYQFEIKHRKEWVNTNADSLYWILYSKQVLRTGEVGGNVIEPDLHN